MGTMIGFEIKKFVASKKNIIILLAFVLFIAVFIGVNLQNERDNDDTKLNEARSELYQVNDLLRGYTDDETVTAAQRYYEQKRDILNSLIFAMGKEDWVKELTLRIELNELILANENPDPYTMQALENEIAVNTVLLEEHIEPIDTEHSMLAFHFIRLAFTGIMPIMMIFVILFVSSDIVSRESETGTYKILLSQPVSRVKILLSKIIAQTGINLIFFTFVFGVAFLALGIFYGFGNAAYPTLFYTGEYVGIARFVLSMFPMILLQIMMFTALSILFSVLIEKSASSISASILTVIALYLIVLGAASETFTSFDPMAYISTANIVSGELFARGATYQKGLAVLGIYSISCYLFAVTIFKRKEYNN